MGSLLLNSTSSQGIFPTDWAQFIPSLIATIVGFLLALLFQQILYNAITGRKKAKAQIIKIKNELSDIVREITLIIDEETENQTTLAYIDPIKTPVWDAVLNTNELQLISDYLDKSRKKVLIEDKSDILTKIFGLYGLINSIKNNYKLAIISNGEASQQRQKLEKTGIKKFFNDIVVANNDTRPKPNCDIFQIACNRQRVDYNQCCYVGDNYYTDMIPCKKLGIRGIYINRKRNSIIDPQISIINNLMELSVILKQ